MVLIFLGVVIAEPAPSPWRAGIVEKIGTPSERWFSPVSLSEGMPPDLWMGPDAVILADPLHVRGLDIATGEVLWQFTDEHLHCERSSTTADVLCASGVGEEVELTRLDARNGIVERTPAPGLLAATALGEDVLSLHENDGLVTLQRQGSDTGTEWNVDLGRIDTSVSTRSGGAQPQQGEAHVRLGTAGDYAMVDMHVFTTDASLPAHRIHAIRHTSDGSAVPDLDDVAWTAQLPGDPRPWLLMGADTGGFRFLNAQGRLSEVVSVETEGALPLLPMLDDDPTSDVVLTSGTIQDQIAARSARGDTTYWSTSASEPQYLIGRVDGLVLMDQAGRTVALDERSGTTVWDDGPALNPFWSVTDGTTLLSIRPTASEITLIGMDVRSGGLEFEVTGGSHVQEGEHAHHLSLVRSIDIFEDHFAVVTSAGVNMWSLN